MITRPGSTKMREDSVPAADATVCTMLFSWIVMPWKPRRMAIEITAAGIDVAKVSPALRPKYTFAAVKISVMKTPRITPRQVSSLRIVGSGILELLTVHPPSRSSLAARRRAEDRKFRRLKQLDGTARAGRARGHGPIPSGGPSMPGVNRGSGRRVGPVATPAPVL